MVVSVRVVVERKTERREGQEREDATVVLVLLLTSSATDITMALRKEVLLLSLHYEEGVPLCINGGWRQHNPIAPRGFIP
jgi:hypothetical protein